MGWFSQIRDPIRTEFLQDEALRDQLGVVDDVGRERAQFCDRIEARFCW